jgi:hypothetical protein
MNLSKSFAWQKAILGLLFILSICATILLSKQKMPSEILPFLVIILGIFIVCFFVFFADLNSNEISNIQS